MPTLREPAHRVSPRAKSMWRLGTGVQALIVLAALAVAPPFLSAWLWLGWAVVAVILVARVVIEPNIRYAVHRWEVTDEAVFTRSGWISRSDHIAPLSRVQTVDSHQTALMRAFGLTNISVSTASAFGAIKIEGLDRETAQQVVAELTEITARTPGDAT